MAHERKSESRLLEATGKTTVAVEGLKARLNREAAAPREATSEDLGRQLEEYFSTAVAKSYSAQDQLRERVIEGVVEKILRAWQEPELKNAIMERLIDRVLEGLAREN
jgi:hypothetical protein